MIAPLRETNTATRKPRRLSEAHQYLAATLISEPEEERAQSVPHWKAWTLVGWMVFAVAYYAGTMLKLW